LVVILLYALVSTEGGYCTIILCTEGVVCGGHQRHAWLHKRAHVARLTQRKLGEASLFSTFPLTPFTDSSHLLPKLCSDYRSAGFLLNDASDHWPIRCVWAGNEMNGTCIPSPLYNSSVTYVPHDRWRKLVRSFRMKIGCSKEDIADADKVPELYICKERCFQAGIGKFPAIIIICIVFLSIVALLMIS
uniref:SPOC domain-containing protein n=1 Tax=Parascaris univalens TaxID=6257 RepID=A0A915A420_PARUN